MTAGEISLDGPELVAVDVLVDDSGRVGPLAYLVPDGLTVTAGDAVTVPFGRQQRHGLVLGPAAAPERATKRILLRLGQRADPADIVVAVELAEFHFATLTQTAARLSPRRERNSTPLDPGQVRLSGADDRFAVPPPATRNRLLLRPPLVSAASLAAREAQRLAADGQVLILSPTTALLEATLAEFSSGAARLDSRARAGAWNGWRSGTVQVGVGTRSAALYSAANLAGIIVVEEEHPGHVESSLPYTHARDVALRRADAHAAALTLISANPSASGIGSKLKVVALPESSRLWPTLTVVDRSSLSPDQRRVPPQLRRLLRAASADLEVIALAEKRQARRICRGCSDPQPCARCTDSGCTHPAAEPCTRCGKYGVSWVGWDAARLRQALPAANPVTFTELQALAPTGRLVVILDVDGLLRAPSLEPVHAAASVLLRCAEAAGPSGTLAVCTSDPTHPVLRMLASRDQVALAKIVYQQARSGALPPFGHLVTVRCGRERPPSTRSWPGMVHGPRRRGNEWEILVQVDSTQLAELRPTLEKLRGRGKTRVWVS